MIRDNIVITFITIIYGIMLTDLFSSLHRLIKSWKSVKWHWLPLLAAWYLFMIILKNWWDLAGFQGSSDWMNIFYFVGYGHLLLLIFLSVSTVLPDSVGKKEIDLKQYYLDNHRYFWGLMTSIVVLSNAIRICKNSAILSSSNTFQILSILVFLILVFTLAVTKKLIVHSIIVIVQVILIVVEIFTRLG